MSPAGATATHCPEVRTVHPNGVADVYQPAHNWSMTDYTQGRGEYPIPGESRCRNCGYRYGDPLTPPPAPRWDPAIDALTKELIERADGYDRAVTLIGLLGLLSWLAAHGEATPQQLRDAIGFAMTHSRRSS